MQFILENLPFLIVGVVGVIWGVWCLPTVIKGWAGKNSQ